MSRLMNLRNILLDNFTLYNITQYNNFINPKFKVKYVFIIIAMIWTKHIILQ